jgi:hypothetical protein
MRPTVLCNQDFDGLDRFVLDWSPDSELMIRSSVKILVVTLFSSNFSHVVALMILLFFSVERFPSNRVFLFPPSSEINLSKAR